MRLRPPRFFVTRCVVPVSSFPLAAPGCTMPRFARGLAPCPSLPPRFPLAMDTRFSIALTACLSLAVACGRAREQAAVERLDPAVDSIVPAGAQVEKLAGGFNFTEGPVWVTAGGYLLFTDNNVPELHKWAPRESGTPFLHGADLDRTNPSIGRLAAAH